MAGKRYDQYNIAPSEAGTTDYKRYPEATHGQDQDLNTTEGDKQRLVQAQQEAQTQDRPEGLPFPPDAPAPSVHANQGHKIDDQEQGAGEPPAGAADSDAGKENPLA